MKKIGRHVMGMLMAFLFVFTVVGCTQVDATKNEKTDLTKGNQTEEQEVIARGSRVKKLDSSSNFQVHFLDVGQADCSLIVSGDHAMLIDAGNNDDEEFILQYLKDQGITKLDYVIGTHPHEDHIGSLDSVIKNFDVGTVMLPEKVHTTKTFKDVISAVEEKNLELIAPAVGDVYPLGESSFTIVAPVRDYGDELNNWSIGLKLESGKGHSFLFCGDAEIEAEYDMLETGIDLSADVLKVSHHGSNTSSSEGFLDAVHPTYGVIMSQTGNSYGHPHKEPLQRLKDRGVELYRTDESGTITVSDTGEALIWETHPDKRSLNESTQSTHKSNGTSHHSKETDEFDQTQRMEGELAKEVESSSTNEEVDVKTDIMVHKTKSGKKYHKAGCSALEKSDEEISLEDAKSIGLTPCKICNPPQ